MKRHVPQEHKKNIMVKLVCGSVAGLLGQTFTYPLDVVRRQMQVIYFLVFLLNMLVICLKGPQTIFFNVGYCEQ